MRVLALCAYWPVHHTVTTTLRLLAHSGYEVQLAMYNCPESLGDLACYKNQLSILDFLDSNSLSAPTRYNLRGKIAKSVMGTVRRISLRLTPQRRLFPKSAMLQLAQCMGQSKPTIVLAVEKGGLALTRALDLDGTAPILYMSLELYTRDHPLTQSDPLVRALRGLEKKIAKSVSIFVVQCRYRWEVLSKDLHLPRSATSLFFPISEPRLKNTDRKTSLREMLNLRPDQKILLYFGVIRPERDLLHVAEQADRMPEGWVMVFHGLGDDATIARIINCSKLSRIQVSRNLVGASDRGLLISSADAGLAIYAQSNANDRFTGYSSEKVALYLQNGIPVIARKNASFQHIKDKGAGVLIDRFDEIPKALIEIERGALDYRSAAQRLYESDYCLENHLPKLMSVLDAVARRSADY